MISFRENPVIYIVDSNPGYRKVIAGCLEALKYKKVKSFDDGESCYSSIEPEPDIIILDFNLGVGKWNGLEFMDEYSRKNKKTKYIFLSSNTKVEVAVEAVRKGAIDYILKSKSGLTRVAKQVDLLKNAMHYKQKEHRLLNLSALSFLVFTSSILVNSLY